MGCVLCSGGIGLFRDMVGLGRHRLGGYRVDSSRIEVMLGTIPSCGRECV